MADWEDYERKINPILQSVREGEDLVPRSIHRLYALMYYAKEDCPDKMPELLDVSKVLKAQTIKGFSERGDNQCWEAYWKVLLFEAPYVFDSYMIYMEKNRPYEKKFYLPRRKVLKVAAQDLQDLEDRKFKFYGLSLPPRVGKSTLCIFFMSWIMGKRTGSHNAMGGHSGVLANGFYQELCNLIETDEYVFTEIFPQGIIQKKSADRLSINLGAPDRFPTITCLGIDGTWTGAVDISHDGYLYVDDLVRDRAHSLSPSRLEGTYQEYLNKMVDRKNDGARELMVGTRWNVLDPLGRIERENKGNPAYRFRKIPALNSDGESNFQYDVAGFSTEFYQEQRARLDANEWQAKYMQTPFVREGLLFPPEELRYYNGVLPEGDYRNVSACDVAWGGGDSLSMPIGREYDNGDVYIYDWVFSRGTKEDTLPVVTAKIISNEIGQINFEANNGGEMYCKYVSDRLKEKHYPCSCTHTKAPGNMAKVEKIIQYSGDIKRRFIFLDPEHQSKEYHEAMEEMLYFVQIGKNEHDDAPDSLAQLARFIGRNTSPVVTIMQSPF